MNDYQRKSKLKNGIFTVLCAVVACAIVGGVISLTGTTVSNIRHNTEVAIAQASMPTPADTQKEDEIKTLEQTVPSDKSLVDTGVAEEVPVAAEPTTYDIEWGDTLSDISRETGRSVDALANANEIYDVDFIYAGSTIVVPDVPVEETPETEEAPEETTEIDAETVEESVEEIAE